MSHFRSVKVVVKLIQKGILQKKLYITEHNKNDEDDFEDFLSMGTIFQESKKEGDDNQITGRGRSDKNSKKSRDSNEDETYHIHEEESEVAHMDNLEKFSQFEGNEALSLVDVLIRLKS